MSIIVLTVLAIVLFTVISNVMRAMRGASGNMVATIARRAEGEALRQVLEAQADSPADLREVLRAARAARNVQESPSFAIPEQNTQFAETLRAALGVAGVAAAEQIVASATTAKKKKQHKADLRVVVPSEHRPGAVLAALPAGEPLPRLHAMHPLAPLHPLDPLAARSARS